MIATTADTSNTTVYLPLIGVAFGWILGVAGDLIRSWRDRSADRRLARQDLERATCISLQDRLGELWLCVREIDRALKERPVWNRSDLTRDVAHRYADLSVRTRVLGSRLQSPEIRAATTDFIDYLKDNVWEADKPPELAAAFNQYEALLGQISDHMLKLMK